MWAWLKKNWRWVVFPVGILTAVMGWFLWWRAPQGDDETSTTTDADANKAVRDIFKAQDVKEAAIKDLEEEHVKKISSMTDEQRAEFEEVKKKPIDEVASWIDNI